MAVNPQQELIWQGRIHLGDEPGVFGDASYSGLAAELPITVSRLDPTDLTDSSFELILESEGLETFGGYPGHKIQVVIYEPDPVTPNHFVERILSQTTFQGTDNNQKQVGVMVPVIAGPFRLSVLLRCDTTVPPGLYDDFVWRRLSLQVNAFRFYASFGFPGS